MTDLTSLFLLFLISGVKKTCGTVIFHSFASE